MKFFLFFFLLFSLRATAQQPAPVVPEGFPLKIPSSFEEAEEEAYARSLFYHRNITSIQDNFGDVTVYGGPAEISRLMSTPVTHDAIVDFTAVDQPYFSVADDRTYVRVLRAIKDQWDLDTFVADNTFQLERLPTPIGHTTHKLPWYAVHVNYRLGSFTPIPVPEGTEARIDFYDPNSKIPEPATLPVINRGGQGLALLGNWYWSHSDIKNAIVVLSNAKGYVMHYDLGAGGYPSTRGSYPLSIAPQTIQVSRTQTLRFMHGNPIAWQELYVSRFGNNHEYIENPVYDVFVHNLPDGVIQYIPMNIVATSPIYGDVQAQTLRVRARDMNGNITRDIEMERNPQSGYFLLSVRSGESSIRAWVTEWPAPIKTTSWGP